MCAIDPDRTEDNARRSFEFVLGVLQSTLEVTGPNDPNPPARRIEVTPEEVVRAYLREYPQDIPYHELLREIAGKRPISVVKREWAKIRGAADDKTTG